MNTPVPMVWLGENDGFCFSRLASSSCWLKPRVVATGPSRQLFNRPAVSNVACTLWPLLAWYPKRPWALCYHANALQFDGCVGGAKLIGIRQACRQRLQCRIGVGLAHGPGYLLDALHELGQARALQEDLVLATIEHAREQ